MKIYILKDEDFQKLLDKLDRDPRIGRGSLTPEQERAHLDVHRMFNYEVRCWMDEVKK